MKKESKTKANFLEKEELLTLENMSGKIDKTRLVIMNQKQLIQNKQLSISNLTLNIDKIKAEIGSIQNQLETSFREQKMLEKGREKVAEKIAEKYEIDLKYFGYDDNTGEVFSSEDLEKEIKEE